MMLKIPPSLLQQQQEILTFDSTELCKYKLQSANLL